MRAFDVAFYSKFCVCIFLRYVRLKPQLLDELSAFLSGGGGGGGRGEGQVVVVG